MEHRKKSKQMPTLKSNISRQTYERYAFICLEMYRSAIRHKRLGYVSQKMFCYPRPKHAQKDKRGNRRHIATILANNNEILIAFRGTKYFGEWLRNFNFLPSKLESNTSKSPLVHSGFNSILSANDPKYSEPLIDCLRKEINVLLEKKSRPINLIGHSLGGALAVLCSHRLGEKIWPKIANVYTFGQPSVGFGQFLD